MFSIDKEKFAVFVSSLRREKGMTQKQMAAELFVSDKAVSKWETAQSLPDVSLLIPLAEILGVTVTELLQGEKMENPQSIPAEEVESLVKTAVSIAEGNRRNNKKIYKILFALSIVTALYGMYYMRYHIYSGSEIVKNTAFLVIAAIVIGIYFLFFVPLKLPRYYDSAEISSYSHGVVRFNMPGIEFTNANWRYIVKKLCIWSILTVATAPFISLVVAYLVEYFFVALSPPYPNPLRRVNTWENTSLIITYLIYFGAMYISVYITAKRHK